MLPVDGAQESSHGPESEEEEHSEDEQQSEETEFTYSGHEIGAASASVNVQSKLASITTPNERDKVTNDNSISPSTWTFEDCVDHPHWGDDYGEKNSLLADIVYPRAMHWFQSSHSSDPPFDLDEISQLISWAIFLTVTSKTNLESTLRTFFNTAMECWEVGKSARRKVLQKAFQLEKTHGGFYRRFMPPDYATIIVPLTRLTKKDVKFEWCAKCDQAFKRVKTLLTTTPVLVHPDFSLPFHVHCDASGLGIGAVLSQYVDGAYRPIAFCSKRLLPHQQHWAPAQLEAYAVFYAVCIKWRYYLSLNRTIVHTDHRNLTWLFGQNQKGMIGRWHTFYNSIPALYHTSLHQTRSNNTTTHTTNKNLNISRPPGWTICAYTTILGFSF